LLLLLWIFPFSRPMMI